MLTNNNANSRWILKMINFSIILQTSSSSPLPLPLPLPHPLRVLLLEMLYWFKTWSSSTSSVVFAMEDIYFCFITFLLLLLLLQVQGERRNQFHPSKILQCLLTMTKFLIYTIPWVLVLEGDEVEVELELEVEEKEGHKMMLLWIVLQIYPDLAMLLIWIREIHI